MAEHVEILAWVVAVIGVVSGGLIMTSGLRKGGKKPAPGGTRSAVKQDWTPTGNIDFHASTVKGSSLQPFSLWVEESRITESMVGQRVVELRWRLATIEEGKELVIYWNGRRASPTAPLRPRASTG
jgi:hypothetical protein